MYLYKLCFVQDLIQWSPWFMNLLLQKLYLNVPHFLCILNILYCVFFAQFRSLKSVVKTRRFCPHYGEWADGMVLCGCFCCNKSLSLLWILCCKALVNLYTLLFFFLSVCFSLSLYSVIGLFRSQHYLSRGFLLQSGRVSAAVGGVQLRLQHDIIWRAALQWPWVY